MLLSLVVQVLYDYATQLGRVSLDSSLGFVNPAHISTEVVEVSGIEESGGIEEGGKSQGSRKSQESRRSQGSQSRESEGSQGQGQLEKKEHKDTSQM